MQFPRTARVEEEKQKITAVMVQQKNPGLPAPGSGCDSRSPLWSHVVRESIGKLQQIGVRRFKSSKAVLFEPLATFRLGCFSECW